MNKLIILRGNAGSGKSTIAQRVRRESTARVAVIGQDYFRHELLNHWGEAGFAARRALILVMATTLLENEWNVIVEGILPAHWSRDMIDEICEQWKGEVMTFYFSLSLEETIRRHKSRGSENFDEDMLKEWYRTDDAFNESDILFTNETTEDDAVQIMRKVIEKEP
jgi:adenylylsulfate kinase-like enzyme